MDPLIMETLNRITPEEQAILQGEAKIDRDLYMSRQGNIINAQKLLASGKLITLRPHTRFIHFPEHTHDYVEVVYVCSGQTTHIVNGIPILLRQGELLFMNQRATHEICKAEAEDVVVNFIVLPAFFQQVLTFLEEEETPLRRFLVDCLCGEPGRAGYLHFKVAQIRPVQNLIENLLFILLQQTHKRQKMSQMTMALLFMQLVGCTEMLDTPNREQADVLKVLSYVESRFSDGSLTELAEKLHRDVYGLSKEIKRKTGKTYTQLIQEKRLAQAAFLLKNTDKNVDDIANSVGYENIGYFHRIFYEMFGVSPRNYRLQIR